MLMNNFLKLGFIGFIHPVLDFPCSDRLDPQDGPTQEALSESREARKTTGKVTEPNGRCGTK
jgi:hypothetical protein